MNTMPIAFGQLIVWSDEVGASLYDGTYQPAPYKNVQTHIASVIMGKGQGHHSIVGAGVADHSTDTFERFSIDAVRPRTARCVIYRCSTKRRRASAAANPSRVIIMSPSMTHPSSSWFGLTLLTSN
jgi:hypothetical protein